MMSSDDHSVIAMEKTPNGYTPLGTAEVLGPEANCPNPSQRPLLSGNVNGARCIVVMGVSGTGKSTLGTALSKAFRLPFIDGDDLHPIANVAKMSRGEPLNDADRQPWLDTIRNTATARVLDQLGVDHGEWIGQATKPDDGSNSEEQWRPGVIVACSSLKRAYRAVLRGEGVPSSLRTQTQTGSTLDGFSLPTYFVYLKGDRDVLMARMQNRKGHFMKAGMLESQLNTLESPEDEPGVVTVSVEMSTAEQVGRVVEMFRSQGR